MTVPRLLRAWLTVSAVLLLVAGCRAGADLPEPNSVIVEPTMQPDDLVDLTVYFRSGEGSSAYLVEVTKEAAISDDLPRQAVAMLIAGPGESDGDLSAPLPSSTRILDLVVTDGTAHLDLSHDVISRADDVNPSPEHEALALAAVAGTLTEFPAIEQVRLSIEGEQTGWRTGVNVGALWGGWGLPAVLVRDESVLSAPAEGDGVPDLALFSSDGQNLGASPADPVVVTSVRVRNRATYLRVIVELATLGDADAPASIPPTRAYADGDHVVLEVDGIAAYEADVEPGQRLEVDDPAFLGVSVADTGRADQGRIVVDPSDAQDFWLHDLSSPTRIVLDVRK